MTSFLWIDYCYFVLFGCFPLFLHFLPPLIKFDFWNSGRAWEAEVLLQQEVRGTRGGGRSCPGKAPRVLLVSSHASLLSFPAQDPIRGPVTCSDMSP